MSAIAPRSIDPPDGQHPVVVAMAIFMSGLFAIVAVLVLATRGPASRRRRATPRRPRPLR